jgi:hypothetical protein
LVCKNCKSVVKGKKKDRTFRVLVFGIPEFKPGRLFDFFARLADAYRSFTLATQNLALLGTVVAEKPPTSATVILHPTHQFFSALFNPQPLFHDTHT